VPFDFRPYEPGFIADPYPTFDEMRSVEPISYQERFDLTLFSRYADVKAILRDRRFGRDALHVMSEDQLKHPSPVLREYPVWTRFNRTLGFIDLEPPDHRRLRGLVSRAFTPKRVEALRPRARELTDQLAAAAAERGSIEAITEFATPIPLTIISEMLAIPEPDRAQLLDWSRAIVGLYELDAAEDNGPAAEQATIDFVEYLRGQVAQRRAHPGDDLMTALIEAEEQGERLSEDELIATCILLLNAGHEATVHGIGNGLQALAAHPDQFELLRRHPAHAAGAAEELLRFDTPLQMFERWVLEDADWEGHQLERGSKVGLLMGAANRDPERFVEPGRLDITREDNAHVAYGGGIHACLGAALARIELQETFGAVARHATTIEVSGEAPRHDSFIFRGVTALPMTLR
jgi:cytochrome P450